MQLLGDNQQAPVAPAKTNSGAMTPMAGLATAVSQAIQNPSSMDDNSFEGLLDKLNTVSISQGKDASQVYGQLNAARDARSQALQDNQKLNWGQQLVKGVASPAVASITTGVDDIKGVTGWLADQAGDVADKIGLSGLGNNLHKFNSGIQSGIQNDMQYGVQAGSLGRVMPAGAKAFVNEGRGQGSWLANVANASLDVTGNFLQTASLAVGGEAGGAVKGAAEIAGTYAGGQMAKDAGAGDSMAQVVTDGMSTFLGGVATGALFHMSGAALGTLGSTIAKTSLGRSLIAKMGETIDNLSSFVSNHQTDSPGMVTDAMNAAQNKLQTAKMGLMGLYYNQVLRPEDDMLPAMLSDTSKARSLVEKSKNEAFGEVFNGNNTVSGDAFGKTSSLIGDHSMTSMDAGDMASHLENLRSLPPQEIGAQGKFQTWVNGLQNLLEKDDINTKALDPYIMGQNPSFGGTGEYDKYASQITASLRNDFKSYLTENEPDMAAQFDRGMNMVKTINDRYKTNVVSGAQGAIDQQDFMQKMVNGEVKGSDTQVSTFFNNLSPSVRTNARASLVNTVSGQAWDALNNGSFSDASYKEASGIVNKFLSNFRGTSALDPTDALRLGEWQETLQSGGVPDMNKILGEGSIMNDDQVAAQAQSVADVDKTVQSLAPVAKAISSGEVSEIPSAYSKMSTEKQAEFWKSVPSTEGKLYVGNQIYADKVGAALNDIDTEGETVNFKGLVKTMQGLADDKELMANGFAPEQKAAIDKFLTYAETVKDLSKVSMSKAVVKMIAGTTLAAVGHPLWGMSIASRGIFDTLKDFAANSAEATPKMQALLDQAKTLSGKADPKSTEVLQWVSNLLTSKGILKLNSEVGSYAGTKATQKFGSSQKANKPKLLE